jgi:hypothetical protein
MLFGSLKPLQKKKKKKKRGGRTGRLVEGMNGSQMAGRTAGRSCRGIRRRTQKYIRRTALVVNVPKFCAMSRRWRKNHFSARTELMTSWPTTNISWLRISKPDRDRILFLSELGDTIVHSSVVR